MLLPLNGAIAAEALSLMPDSRISADLPDSYWGHSRLVRKFNQIGPDNRGHFNEREFMYANE
jgi:hypothetical protein